MCGWSPRLAAVATEPGGGGKALPWTSRRHGDPAHTLTLASGPGTGGECIPLPQVVVKFWQLWKLMQGEELEKEESLRETVSLPTPARPVAPVAGGQREGVDIQRQRMGRMLQSTASPPTSR